MRCSSLGSMAAVGYLLSPLTVCRFTYGGCFGLVLILEAGVVVHHDVVGGRDRALANVLRHQEEVIPVTPRHGVVQGTTV